MRLRAEQLADHIERQGLSGTWFVSGDEPLQMLETTDFIREKAREHGCEERLVLEVGRDFDWTSLATSNAEMSLFASRRLIELRMGEAKPGKEGGAALVDYVSANTSDDVLLISSARIDKRTQQSKWFKALDESGVCIQLWPVEAGQLPSWISYRMKSQGKSINRDAADLIAERVEGNLLAAKQEIDKLALLVESDRVELQDVMDSVSDSSRYDVFDLVASSLGGNTTRMTRMLNGLKSEGAEPLAIFGALMWEIRRVCSVAHDISAGISEDKAFYTNQIWQQKKAAVKAVLRRYNPAQLDSILRYASIVDRGLKGAIPCNRWDLLENYLFRIAGVRLQSFPSPQGSS